MPRKQLPLNPSMIVLDTYMARDEEEFDRQWRTLKKNLMDIWPDEGGANRIIQFIQKIIDDRDEYKHQMEVEREINGQTGYF